jgi:transcriptional regulator with XRE-family HTH domain
MGLSQEALALAAHVERSNMGKIERGENNLSVLNLARISAALDCVAAKLLEEAGL